MKRILALICCLSSVFCLFSCTYTQNGLENFSRGDSQLELTYMVPDGFIESFPYAYGDYFYREEYGFSSGSIEKFVVYMKYNGDIYSLAKEEALNYNRIDSLEESYVSSIGTCDFYLSGLDEVFKNTYTDNTIYMYIALDEANQMIFFLCLCSDKVYNKKDSDGIKNLYETEGLKGIIDEYFIEWYDFYATNNV